MFKPLPVLIVSSNPSHRNAIVTLVRKCKLRPVLAPSLADARLILDDLRPVVVFCSDEIDGSKLCDAIHALRFASGAPVIAISHLDEWGPCVEAMSACAFDYIACPPDPKEARRVLGLALEDVRRANPRATAA